MTHVATAQNPLARLEQSTHAIAAQQLVTHGTLSAAGTALAPDGQPRFDDGRSQVSRDRSGVLVKSSFGRISAIALNAYREIEDAINALNVGVAYRF